MARSLRRREPVEALGSSKEAGGRRTGTKESTPLSSTLWSRRRPEDGAHGQWRGSHDAHVATPLVTAMIVKDREHLLKVAPETEKNRGIPENSHNMLCGMTIIQVSVVSRQVHHSL